MRRCAIVFLVCLFVGLDVQAGKEYPAKPGEEVVANELIVRLVPGATASTLIAKYLRGAQIQALTHAGFFRIRVPGGLPNGVSAQIAADLQVDFVEPNRVRHSLLAAPNDPNYSSSWWLPAVQALQAWSLLPGQYLTAATAGTGRVKVAVLDTGADCTHPDFINTGGTSTDSAHGGQLMFSASQAIVATTIVNPVCTWQDDHGHGTHVTGILAAATSNAVGVSGLAYPVQVMEFKVLNSAGSGSDTDIMNAIEAAANAGAQVVSMSLGGTGYSSTLQTAINYAWQHNTLVVAAAGNDAKNELFFPAGANHAVGVSATDSGNNLAYFSNFGNAVQLAAPGLGILSTAPTYSGTSQGWLNYVSLSGTSMATPFVSALAGLVAMTTPNATAQSILQRMEQTASSTTTGGGWGQNFGFGLINASGAVAGTLRAATNGAITGQIVDTFSNPISGAQITVNGQNITTDTTGLYRFGTLPAGTYPVTVSATGYATQTLSATVAPGADTSFTVTMGVTYGKFTGTVTDQGVGVAGAIVQALSAGLITGVAVADQNGQYALWVPGGTYDLRTSAIGRVTTTVSALTVGTGGTTSANLTLPRMGTIAGSVWDGSSNPVANAQVLVTGGSFSAAATTDVNGNYSLIGVPTGSPYSATATATGFVAATQNGLAVSADLTTSVSFTMASSTVATPTFNPAAGSYSATQMVTISTTTTGASIHYTTDGTAPTSSVGTPYNNTPVAVNSSLTLKAIAYMAGMADSAVATAAYTITSGGGGPAWYNSSWTNRKAITVDHTKVSGSGSLTNFPLLFSVTDPNLMTVANGGSVGKADGTDILFTASDGVTKLNHEVEFYSASTGQVAAWVQLPALSPSADTTVYVYYGNAGAADQQNQTGVWDSNYKLVWHLGNGITLSGADSTSNGANGIVYSGGAAAGKIAGGAAGMVQSQSNGLVWGDQTRTLECWFKITGNAGSDQVLCGMGFDTGTGTIFSLLYRAAGSTLSLDAKGIAQSFAWTFDSNWHHLAASYTSGSGLQNAAVYLDGVPKTTSGGTGTLATQWATYFSVEHSPAYSVNDMTGIVDEFRLSSTARSPAWIATEYNNQNSPATFYAVGGQQTSGGGQSQAATPTFNPPAGSYGTTQMVAISTTTSGALIHYTTDGSTPSSTAGIAYTGSIAVSSNVTLKAVAYESGMADSAVATAAYTIQAATPTFNPPAGSYSATQMVAISTTTTGASIHYTTDGSTPSSTAGIAYTGSIAVSSNVTLKAVAYMAGMADSAVATAAYTIQTATPTFNPPAGSYSATQMVAISTTTTGASIHYTTDGTAPTSSVGTPYNNTPVAVNSSLTLKAIAYKAGMADSAVATAAYTITSGGGGPAWYNSSWTNRKAITVDHTKVSGSGSLTNFPLLFSVTDPNLMTVANGGSVGKADGTDILFTASDGVTKLNHEVEFYSPSTGQVAAWVQLPALSPSADTTVYVYYGNAGAADQQNQTGVWDSNYKLVWHLGNGITLSGADSTSNGANGVVYSGGAAAGKIAGGAAGMVQSQSNGLVWGDQTRTLECWFKITGNAGSDQVLCGMGFDTGTGTIFSLLYRAAGSTLSLDAKGIAQSFAWTFDSNWHHLAASYTSGSGLQNAAVYLDGVPKTTTGGTGTLATQWATYFSVEHSPAYSVNDMTGIVDEFRLSSTARSPAWIATEYNNQNSPATFYAVGGQQTSGGGQSQAATPTFNPPAGSYGTTQMVAISTTTSGALIHYTTDGSTPSSTAGIAYTGSIAVSSNVTLKAVAYESGMADSAVATAAYTIQAATPTFNPPAGSYSATQMVAISTTTTGASIHYTTDGSTPSSTAGIAYTGSIAVSSNVTLKAVAYMAGMADSAVATAAYTIQTATPTFNPPAGSYSATQMVTISTTTTGASIHYTTDGTAPTSSVGTPYNNTPVAVNSSLTLKAIAYKAGMADSAVATAAYTITSGGGGPAWYNSSWTNRKAITVDHTKVSGSGSLTNFPLLFSVTDPNLMTVANGGSVGKADGTDILFTASDGVTKLNHEVEFYSPSTGQVAAWVQLPALSPSADTTVYVYYGNAGAADQQNQTGVWDSNYKLVWHLGNGITLSGADSTSNGANGVVYSGGAAAGKIAGGAAGMVQSQSNGLVWGDQTRTLECWFKITGNAGSDQVLCGMGFDTGTGTIFSLLYRAAGSTLSLDAKGIAQSFAWTFDSNWHHLAASYTSGSGLQNAAVYLDGVPKTTSGGTGTLATQWATYFSVEHSPAYSVNDMTGIVDEFRLSSTARPPAWIATEYNNQNSPATFYAVGGQE